MKYVVAKLLVAVLSAFAVCHATSNNGTPAGWGFFQNYWRLRIDSPAELKRRQAAFWDNLPFQVQDAPIYLRANMFADTTPDEWLKIEQAYAPPDDDDWGRQPARDNNDPEWDGKQKKYKEKYSFVNTSWTSIKAQPYHTVLDQTIPLSLDWRKRMVVPNFEAVCCVIDCRYGTYAWAVVVTLISHLNIKLLETERRTSAPVERLYDDPTIYSIQQLIDCLGADDVFFDRLNICQYHDNGGNGLADSVVRAYKHVIMNGLELDTSYSYKRGNYSECKYNKAEAKKAYNPFNGYVKLERFDEVSLAQALAFYGPITVSFNPSMKGYWLYSGGILIPKDCKSGKTVSMVLVGYGLERGHRYWLLMSPWGERWGRSGMLKMKWFSGKGCNIAGQAIFPTWAFRDNITSYDYAYWNEIEKTRAKYVHRVYSNKTLSELPDVPAEWLDES
uniref:Peptidase C1A papain C-terminal domain-containing protein n=1 Tax=Lygus hesperus TaxID=30085 RepID=A0A0K8S8Z3_LYGHE